MRILSIGTFTGHGISNTCLHRTWALEKLGEVDRIDTTLKRNVLCYRIVNRLFVRYHLPFSFHDSKLNRAIRKQVQEKPYDVVWIDKGVFIEAKALRFIKQVQPSCRVVGYSPDNMAERHNQTQVFLKSFPYYDYYITTKSYTVDMLRRMGCKNILFVNNAYEASFHHPYQLAKEERERLGGKVGFIGAWEEERCRSILYLAEHGIPVRVWGGGKWLEYKDRYTNLKIEDKGLYSEDYNKALSAFDISLCFLRKINYDLQTTRTMEIPACGSLLMAERTAEHERLFKDKEEAVFFSSDEELLELCQYYLTHEEERKRIAEAGRKRCIASGYSNEETIKRVLEKIFAECMV
ncbi:MAG: glycosyltransferase [Prevotella sp.]|nr:glycosyltransferase [Prevotella sp.]